MKKLSVFLLIFLTVFGLDFYSKLYVYNHLEQFFPRGYLIFDSGFGIRLLWQYVENRGGAWGALADYHTELLIFRVCVIGFLFFYLMFSKQRVLQFLGISMVIAGAFSNVFDCFFYGHVIDMIHFTFWGNSYGVFNVADAAIFMGAIAYIFARQFQKKPKKKKAIAE